MRRSKQSKIETTKAFAKDVLRDYSTTSVIMSREIPCTYDNWNEVVHIIDDEFRAIARCGYEGDNVRSTTAKSLRDMKEIENMRYSMCKRCKFEVITDFDS